MFESNQNKRNSKKGSFFSSDKKSGLNIGGGLSVGKQAYETSVAKRAIKRAGKNKNLHGHVNEILTVDKHNLNPLHIIKGEKAVLTKSPTAVRDDIVVKAKKTGKVIKRMQLKDTTSKSGIRDTAKKVKDHHYKGYDSDGNKRNCKKICGAGGKRPPYQTKNAFKWNF